MGAFRYVPDSVVAERHRAKAAQQPRPDLVRKPVTKNVEPVLSLGEVRYISFRRRVLGIPPVSYKTGHRLLDLYTKTLAAGKLLAERGAKEHAQTYFEGLDQLKRMMWRHCFPAGKLRRLARRLGMLTNPFALATEQEVLELADFFLKGRMRSNIQFSLPTPAEQR